MSTFNRTVQFLRNMLTRVEVSSDLNPDDPALVELKRVLILRLAEIEREGHREGESEETVPEIAHKAH